MSMPMFDTKCESKHFSCCRTFCAHIRCVIDPDKQFRWIEFDTSLFIFCEIRRRRKSRNIIPCVAMRRQLRNNTLQSRRSRLQKATPLHISRWQWKCICEEYETGGRSVDGRLQRVLLCVGAVGEKYTIRKVSVCATIVDWRRLESNSRILIS